MGSSSPTDSARAGCNATVDRLRPAPLSKPQAYPTADASSLALRGKRKPRRDCIHDLSAVSPDDPFGGDIPAVRISAGRGRDR